MLSQLYQNSVLIVVENILAQTLSLLLLLHLVYTPIFGCFLRLFAKFTQNCRNVTNDLIFEKYQESFDFQNQLFDSFYNFTVSVDHLVLKDCDKRFIYNFRDHTPLYICNSSDYDKINILSIHKFSTSKLVQQIYYFDSIHQKLLFQFLLVVYITPNFSQSYCQFLDNNSPFCEEQLHMIQCQSQQIQHIGMYLIKVGNATL
eukprot:TRINITY_DN3130_c0_g1_i4.p2 TRINITY_DN3130_c0_g1~~TRINITY_DN3130_c0_g1_i4.p2  ORF type:complete len:202 (-),score=-15.57 TRINITY_DN3130_c0_g1_i4:133-738(-)